MYQIKEQILQATLNYLATRPFNEVANLIAALQQSQKTDEKEPEMITAEELDKQEKAKK